MKNLFNFGFVALILVVLGCNCQKFKEIVDKAKETPTNTPTVSNTSSSPASSSSPTSSTSPTKSSSGALTKAQFNELKNGLSYSEVVDILGKEGKELKTTKVGSTKISTYQFEGSDNTFIFCNFTNDKMSFKSDANLK